MENNHIQQDNYINLRNDFQGTRRVRDNIYGFIEFDHNIWSIIDTPEFQRLRHIKQLGVTDLVFPGGNHSRFEHSLGTAHLSNILMDNLAKNHQYNYNEMQLENKNQFLKYKTLLQIAGLCHDLGHGPFSHMFDNELLPKLGVTNWKHEQGSQMLVKRILEKDEIIQKFEHLDINKNDIDTINQLIDGKEYIENDINSQHPGWIYEIISNKKNSIDVDKFDYMRRDAYNSGISGFDYDCTTIMRETRVIDNTLAYHQKHSFTIYDLYGSRYKLYKSLYQHRVSQGLELMICDALYEANPVYKFNEIIYDANRYINLNDSIIQQIKNSDNPALQKSKQILEDIDYRRLYQFVTEQLINAQSKIDKTELKKYLSKNCKIDENIIYIITFKTSYCMQDKNPVDYVDFYQDPKVKFKTKKEQVSLILPNQFQEQYIRIFIKNNKSGDAVNEEQIQKLKENLGKFLSENNIKSKQGYNKNSKNPKNARLKDDQSYDLYGTPQKRVQK
ncbi:hypothetical protein PPERSA_01504 [Pseudocohnilembus persalinus]|uniref:HD/PDEase domain-containing protein n=1 Tax=Pseudocohnilembus persalinus TaxID=266149 RepID=A0A0V0QH78_PSEPJ|nr:hypothetical protein PPERSA_01504 [Pseudocohnilembus persalinus]|eukprot:KRX01601.1 hypothetical protein PPERSA_01504 [Pseudocohnilembus persalinus]